MSSKNLQAGSKSAAVFWSASQVLLLHLQGYSFVPGYDDAALKEALYTRGPLATSIDASQPSFRFYSHGKGQLWLHDPELHGSTAGTDDNVMLPGVYDEPNCLWKPDDLDHAVAIVGYGKSEDGDYWIVRCGVALSAIKIISAACLPFMMYSCWGAGTPGPHTGEMMATSRSVLQTKPVE